MLVFYGTRIDMIHVKVNRHMQKTIFYMSVMEMLI